MMVVAQLPFSVPFLRQEKDLVGGLWPFIANELL
jgi:hypothetical protein